MILLATIMVAMMLMGAVAALVLKNHVAAVAATSLISVALSVLFVLLRAPDVAMTEAAVGAGLSALILALALRKLDLWQVERREEGASS